MYGIGGERRLDERIVTTLPGYENSRPVVSATRPPSNPTRRVG